MTDQPRFRLLETFAELFRGVKYRHRLSQQGDSVAVELYEDLYNLSKSKALRERIACQDWVVNLENKQRGIRARRGDGTFGEKVPGAIVEAEGEYAVRRSQLATIEIGIEVKILAKAMIKQVDRVSSDFQQQVRQFKRGGGTPICVGIVGVNYADQYTSYERTRKYPTDGKKHKHPVQEAPSAEKRLADAVSAFDFFLLLRFKATNVRPFPFSWVDEASTIADYGAILTRISREYDRRFGT